MKKEDKQPERKRKRVDRDVNRGRWGSKAEFILSLIGYAVGIGNVWRFPYLCYRSGGGVFLVPYLLMLLLCGIPLFYMEVLIGQFSGTGCTGMFRLAPLLTGVGIAIVVVNIFCVCYYSVVISLPVHMLAHIYSDPPDWVGCDHSWNTENCTTDLGSQNITENSHFATSADEFFHLKILQISSGIEELGGIVWLRFASLLLTWTIIYICVIKGIKSVGKVVYFTATFPYVLLTILFIRGITLPGAGLGIKFYLSPDWKRLIDLRIWIDAAVQIFFSLGPGWGGIVNMASFNDFRNNAKIDSILIPIVNSATSIYAGFVVFSVLGFLSVKSGIPVDNVATSGPGLAFVTYPEAIAMMPWANFWAALFYIMLFLLGIDSVFVQIEAIVSSLLDEFKPLRSHKKKLTLCACIIFFLMSIIMTMNGGMYVLQIFDWYSASLSVILICIFELIMVCYIYGIKNFCFDIEFMLGKKPSWIWKVLWKYVTPIILIIVLLTSLFEMRRITYNGKEFPDWAVAIGWCSAASSVMWIPLYILYIIIRKRSIQSLRNRLKPMDWTPADPDDRIQYEHYRKGLQMPSFMSDTSLETATEK